MWRASPKERMERTAVLVGRQGPRAGVSSMMGAPLALRSRRSALALQLRSGRRLGRGCQGKRGESDHANSSLSARAFADSARSISQ